LSQTSSGPLRPGLPQPPIGRKWVLETPPFVNCMYFHLSYILPLLRQVSLALTDLPFFSTASLLAEDFQAPFPKLRHLFVRHSKSIKWFAARASMFYRRLLTVGSFFDYALPTHFAPHTHPNLLSCPPSFFSFHESYFRKGFPFFCLTAAASVRLRCLPRCE